MCPVCAALIATITLFGAGTASTAALGVAFMKRIRSISPGESIPNQIGPKETNNNDVSRN